MPVAQRWIPHVAQADSSFAAAVNKGVALMGVELGRRDDLGQLLHVCRLDVDNVWEAGVKAERGLDGDFESLLFTTCVVTHINYIY